MTSIPIGVPFAMTQNIEYALPAMSVFVVSTTATIQTALSEGGSYVTTTSPVLTKGFIRCATGNATILLAKNGVE